MTKAVQLTVTVEVVLADCLRTDGVVMSMGNRVRETLREFAKDPEVMLAGPPKFEWFEKVLTT